MTDALRRVPWIVWAILLPSWIFFLATGERATHDTEQILFFYVPDLVEGPLRVIPNLTVTPWVNTETDQILLITGLVGIFGTLVERRVGGLPTLAIFWITSAAGAVFGGLLWHLLHPLFPDFHPIANAELRVFNGASAGAFGLMAAYAALSPRPWIVVGLFVVWEPTFWYFISEDYTSVIHIIAFATGFFMVWRALAVTRVERFQKSL